MYNLEMFYLAGTVLNNTLLEHTIHPDLGGAVPIFKVLSRRPAPLTLCPDISKCE